MQKCYGVTIAGKVQDIGLRNFIENIARSHFLKGKKELPLELPLPGTFTKVSTDDVEDIGRKLDKAYIELNGINAKLDSVDSRLFSIGENTHNLNTTMSSFVLEQREHNQHLEKI